MKKFFIATLTLAILHLWLICVAETELPGVLEKGVILLPNGWKISPAGRHLPLDDLPLEMVESKDGNYLIVTNNGYSKPVLSIVDLQRFYVRDRVSVEDAWLGLAWNANGTKLYSSSGGIGGIQVFAYKNGNLKSEQTYRLNKPVKESFVGGLCVNSDDTRLYAVQILGNTVSVLDSSSGNVLKTVPVKAEPYTCVVSPDNHSLFVSLWGASKILELDASTLVTKRTFQAGEHPAAMALSTDGRLFVACANTNTVWVFDLSKGTAEEQISVALYPYAPVGSTPSALGISRDSKKLLATNSDNNAVAVVDISNRSGSKVLGFIPTGWYPTAARFSRDNKRIFILSGKGLRSVPNPRGPDEPNYIGQLLLGSLSILENPDAKQLESFTKVVYGLTPYSDAIRLTPPRAPQKSPVPHRIGDASPIKHVFYIIRENRTYDQILGDMKSGNGDPTLCLFGEAVTPNAHALAQQFVLFDNFYVDAEVSADGHAFSTGAYAPDFIEKTWPMNYAERGGAYLTEGDGEMRNAYGNIAAPPNGYIWDAASTRKITVRSYGEFAHWNDEEKEDGEHKQGVHAGVPGLKNRLNQNYPAWDLKIPDNRRVDIWLEEFHKFEKDGKLPQLTIMHLPNDHTAGTSPGYRTPRAMVAENDVALGRIVEAISNSPFWKNSVIFVLEDDAQDGPDHVDAHRSVAFVISPYARRRSLDSTMYTTSGMLRTIELILGIEPLSQYDAAASPMYGAFQTDPDLTPYKHRPAKISTEELNAENEFGAKESMAMNFRQPDRIPMRQLNEILWKSIKGYNSEMPPPVRAAFIRDTEKE